MKFRDLTADEIEVRVAQVKENGVSLLLYKNARCDMNILDETVGADKWQDKFYEAKGILFCSIGIKCGDEWIWKGDAGSESNTEAEKGNASDARKRAGFAWGIGRELYTSPFIWIPSTMCNIKGTKCYDRFEVNTIAIEDKKIVSLSLYNDTKKCECFRWEKGNKKSEMPVLKQDKIHVDSLIALAQRKGYTENNIKKQYGVKAVEDLTDAQYRECANNLQKLEDK